jgi:uncharacterized protein (TIGR02147 family)
MKPNIFTYLDYRRYLKDVYKSLKETTTHFSFRYFARVAGFRSPNYLKLVMDGARNLSQEGVRKFCKGLWLNRSEQEFFENLVHMNQSGTDEEKNFYYLRLTSSKKYVEAKGLEKDQYEYFSKWYHVAIREMVALPDFRDDPKWIAKKLGGEILPKEAAAAVKLLIRIKLLERDDAGKLKQADSCLTTGPEVRSLAVANFHREMLKKAAHSIEKTSHRHRDISSLTIPVSKETLKKVKEKIQDFRKELHAFVAAEKDFDTVYQFNFQLFNLSEVVWTDSEE